MMQLLIGLRDTWKSIDVRLEDGCMPCVGGVPLSECNIEPALWFKVLVLDSVTVDCSQRVISWSAAPSLPASGGSHSTGISQALGKDVAQMAPTDASKKPKSNGMTSPTRSLSSSLLSSARSLSLRGSLIGQGEGHHSLMAPHEGETSLCQDDLHNLFELAEMLFKVNASCLMHTRGLDVEQRSWLRLLHCYLLPVISLHHDDLPSVERASATHTDIITSLDLRIAENSSRAMSLKQELVSLREQLQPGVRVMGEEGRCSKQFLSLFTSDLRAVEEEARNKIQTTMQNLDLSGKLSLPLSSEREEQFRTEQRMAESTLLQTLQLRGALEAALCLLNSLENGTEGGRGDGEDFHLQERYVEKHHELEKLREMRSELSKKKVLALSVREALQQTLLALRSGKITTGMDVGLRGGHSTDVLPEASDYSASNEYTTLRDKVQRLLQLSSGPASHLHKMFCDHLRQEYFPAVSNDFVLVSQPVSLASFHQRTLTLTTTSKRPEKENHERRHFSMRRHLKRRPSLPNLQYLAQSVKEHYEKVMEAICQHFNDRDVDFQQRVWLCYERLFFELFGSNFLPLYQAHFAKFCEQLQLNSVSASVVNPEDLNLGITDESWLCLFPPRPFAEAQRLYQGFTDQQCLEEERETGDHDAQFWAHFGGVASDLTSVPLALSPLEKLQLLTSAFRKAMAALSELKTQSLLAEASEEDSVDMALVGVSCDDLLPLLALILLQLDPSFLASLFLHTSLLADYMAPFLEAGWHGYSLAAFRSALQIIAEL